MKHLLGLVAGVLTTVVGASAQAPPSRDDSRVTSVAPPKRFVGPVQSMSFGDGSLWISCHTIAPVLRDPEGRVYRIDPRTFETVASWPIAGCVVFGEGAVWVRHGPEAIGLRQLPENLGALSKIDPRTNQVIAKMAVDRTSGLQKKIAVGEGGVWLPSYMKKNIVRLDPRTHQVVATIPIEGQQLDLTIGEGSIWILVGKMGIGQWKRVLRLDPKTNRIVAAFAVDASTARIVAGEGWLWAIEQDTPIAGLPSLRLTRINPATHQAHGSPILLGRSHLRSFALGPGGLWVAQDDPKSSKREGMYSFVDAKTGQMRDLPLDRSLSAHAITVFGDGAIWLGNAWTSGTFLYRVQP